MTHEIVSEICECIGMCVFFICMAYVLVSWARCGVNPFERERYDSDDDDMNEEGGGA